jgi:PTH1 family peptidyl-tRNA hydrolase
MLVDEDHRCTRRNVTQAKPEVCHSPDRGKCVEYEWLDRPMKLVVGLGNPGVKYRKNRHNVGFWAVERVAEWNHAADWKTNFSGLVADCRLDDQRVLLVKPMTYMNLSGQSVRQAADFYRVSTADILVVCDDFSLPLGALRIRARGSAGGQRGMDDILRSLGSEEIARVRIGIGSPGAMDPADYVLSNFRPDEEAAILDTVIDAGRAIECWCSNGVEAAMNQFNRKRPDKE